MKPFLLLSIRADDAAADNEYESFLSLGGLAEAQLHRTRLEQRPLGQVDLRDWSGIMLGGGPFNFTDAEDGKTAAQLRVEADLQALLSRVVEADFPFLGACYGVGALGRVLGATLDRQFAEPVGAVRVTLTEAGQADALFGAMPRSFDAFTGHKEAVSQLPAQAVLLASSQRCPVQAFRAGANVYATQFHPELDMTGLETRLEVYKHAGYFPPEQADEIREQASRHDVSSAPIVLRAFIKRYGVQRPGRVMAGAEATC